VGGGFEFGRRGLTLLREILRQRGGKKSMSNLMDHIETRLRNLGGAPRCGAKTRAGSPCKGPALRGRSRCRLHGGLSSGAPRGAKNGNYRTGDWTSEAVEERKWLYHRAMTYPYRLFWRRGSTTAALQARSGQTRHSDEALPKCGRRTSPGRTWQVSQSRDCTILLNAQWAGSEPAPHKKGGAQYGLKLAGPSGLGDVLRSLFPRFALAAGGSPAKRQPRQRKRGEVKRKEHAWSSNGGRHERERLGTSDAGGEGDCKAGLEVPG
jgi:hypothetical protein